MAKRTYEIEFLGSDEVIKKQAQLTLELRKTNEAIKEAKKNSDDNLYKKLVESQLKLKEQIKQTNQEIKNQKKEFESSKYPTDSLKALELSYVKVKNEVKNLSEQERKSQIGQDLIKKLGTLRTEVNKTKASIGELTKSFASNFGDSLKQGLGFGGAAGLGLAASGLVKDSFNELIQLEKLYFQIRELTQASIADIELYKSKIPELSNILGIAQKELVQALYEINSRGIIGAKALDLLAESARLSAIGFGDVNVVAQSLAGAINAYGGDVEAIGGTVKALFKLVQQGSGDIAGFASSFSKVTTLASQLNIPIEQLAGNIANITNKGTPAAEAVTQLQSVFIGLLKPTTEGSKQLEKVNLSYEKIRKLASVDLAQALDLLNSKLGGNAEAMATVFGRSESLQGVFSNTGKNADGLAKIMANMNNEFEGTTKIFERFDETNGQKITRFFNYIKNAAITTLGEIINFSEKFGKFYNNLYDIVTFQKKKQTEPVKQNDNLDPYGESFLKEVESFNRQDEFNKIANEKIAITEEEKKKIEAEKEKRRKEQIEINKKLLAEEKKLYDEEIKQIEIQDKELENLFKNIRKEREEELRNSRKALAELGELRRLVITKDEKSTDSSVKKAVSSLADNQIEFDFDKNKIEEKKQKLKDEIIQISKELSGIGIDTLQDLAYLELNNKQKIIEKNRDLEIKALEEEYELKKQFAQGNFELINKLNAEQAQQREQIEIASAKRLQALNIKKALADGALAIIKTFAQVGFLAGIPLALLQAAATAKQIAIIKSNGFAEGGRPAEKDIHIGTGYVKGAGTETSDSIPAFLSNKEYVLNAKMVKILGLEFLERLRRSTLGYSKYLSHPARKYATGGAVGGTTFVPNVNLPPSSQPIQTTAVFDRENIIAFGESVAGIIADEVQNALAKGLYDANSRLQREQRQKQRSAA